IVDGYADPDGDYQYRTSNLYTVDLNTGTTHSLTPDKGNWHNPVVSPDGKHIAYVGFASTSKTYHTSGLYVMDIDGKNSRFLTEALDRDAGDLHWASDNTGIYFDTEDRGSRNVYFAPLTGAVKTVTTGIQQVGLGSISKTGIAAITRSTKERPA